MKSNTLIAQFVDILDTIQNETGRRIPGLIMSSPGAGKTSTIEKFCELRDYNLTSLIASQYAPDDIIGLQSVVGGGEEETARLRRLTPDWYDRMIDKSKNGKKNVLFIDEISTCDETIQAPLLNLIFSGDVGGKHSIPESTLIIAAGNYSDNLNGAFQMTTPLVNRFLILNIKSEDQDLNEMLNVNFRELQGSELEEFLQLKATDNIFWDCDKIDRRFIFNKIKIKDKAEITNNSEEGLIGFASLRAIDYCRTFMFYFARKYKSDLWMRVLGDTLGKIDDGNQPYPSRAYLESKSDKFVYYNGIKASGNKTLVQSILEACEKGQQEGFDHLSSYISKPRDLTSRDLDDINKASGKIPEVKAIYSKIAEALMGDMYV